MLNILKVDGRDFVSPATTWTRREIADLPGREYEVRDAKTGKVSTVRGRGAREGKRTVAAKKTAAEIMEAVRKTRVPNGAKVPGPHRAKSPKTWTCRSEIGVRTGCGKGARVVDLVREKKKLAEKVEKANADLDREIESAKKVEADRAAKEAAAVAAAAEKAAKAEQKKLAAGEKRRAKARG